MGKKKTMAPRPQVALLVAVYLAAIVAANLISTHYGPAASVYNAFFLIGLDLTTRDRLHDFWRVRRWLKLGGLIVAGSALSYLVNRDAARVAEASAVAFAAAAVADTLVYQLLHGQSWFTKVNGSNVVSSAVDSVLFPTIAFGSFLWAVSFGQFTAKVAGGMLWAFVIVRVRDRRRPPAAEAARA